MHLGRTIALAITAICALGSATQAQAQAQETYPSKPITWVVPYGAGGGPDTVARTLAPKVAAAIGQPIVIDNRAGAGGTVGAGHVANAKPDGYTILHGSNGTHAVGPVLYGNLSYDPAKDFVGISRLTSVEFMLLVPATSRFQTLEQFLAELKARPDQLTYGSSGNGSIPHIAAEAFATATGTKIRHIPYKAVPAVLNDLLGGRLDFMVDSTTNSYALVKGGRLRALAVLTSAPKAFPPEVPTLASIGVQNFQVAGWDIAFVPAGTPRSVVDKLNKAITQALEDPEVQKAFTDKGLQVVPTSVAQTAQFLKDEIPRWMEATRRTGARAE